MNNKKKKKPVSPIYIIAIIWLLFSIVIHPINTIGLIGLVLVISGAGYGLARLLSSIFSRNKKEEEPEHYQAVRTEHKVDVPRTAAQETIARQQAEKPKEPPKPKYPPEVEAVVNEGRKAHMELARLYATIPDLKIKRKIQKIIEVSDKIVQDAIDDPSDVPQIKKFLDYYLPTTIKLLNAYERMGAQGVEGQNITGTMQSIDEMLDTAIDAYNKLLDSLFADQAMDVETDIQVMNTLLKREGFISGSGGSAFQVKKE